MRIAYGYNVSDGPKEDKFVTLAEELARLTAKATSPGRWLVDSFPARTQFFSAIVACASND